MNEQRQPTRESVDRTAAALQETAKKAGQEISHDQAKTRVLRALQRKGKLE